MSKRNETNRFIVGELRVGKLRVGELRVGEMGVGEMRRSLYLITRGRLHYGVCMFHKFKQSLCKLDRLVYLSLTSLILLQLHNYHL